MSLQQSKIKTMRGLQTTLRRSLCALTSATLLLSTVQAQEVQTVGTVDLQRYAGTWYEIAKFPNRFQKKCIANTRADYAAQEDGRISVLNQCKVAGGVVDQVNGVARIVDTKTNARLKVRFAPAWLSWLPFVWGDYWIIGLTPDYSVATVGSPDRDYLWILSRTKSLSTAAYDAAVDKATRQGFDTSKLEKSVQE
ncbi:lipocalin family protein [Herbaspirillum sp. RTI4]|uniref:lipocalin family protein n=1 Tax=Herbaspirillum sp. RTI4 TaxID=3048640 RepID=UPI002AB4BF09|nr:lipocalin family protein [Herbaspirillum sp. RTI4]MDY7577249.1 lipocalin family protein [Herbaspirillum sp. RTI4]MEA9980539.1 lipocalin family protein [Herbaspirillum sp. RTI4]